MNKIDRIIKQTINEAVYKIINEGKSTLKLGEFTKLMKSIGIVREDPSGDDNYKFYLDGVQVTVADAHKDDEYIDAATPPQVFRYLLSIGWFRDPNNFRKFPFESLNLTGKIKQAKSQVDFSKEDEKRDLEIANEKYKDAELVPAEQVKGTYFIMKVDDKFNMCKSSEDRRPLYNQWFDSFEPDKKTHSILCLKFEDWDTYETRAYPITASGLDIEHFIIENRKYRNKRLW